MRDSQSKSRTALAITEVQHGCSVFGSSEQPARSKIAGRLIAGGICIRWVLKAGAFAQVLGDGAIPWTVTHNQPCYLLTRLLDTEQLHDLIVFVCIEGQAAACIALSTAKHQATVLGLFVVEEQEPCDASLMFVLLSSNDGAREFGGVGDHAPKPAIRFPDVYPLDVDLFEVFYVVTHGPNYHL